MPFMGTSSNIGGQRVGSAHTARELAATLDAGSTTTFGPIRTLGMQRCVFVIEQSTVGAVATVDLQYRIGLTWRNLVVNVPAVVGQPIVVTPLLPGARQVRARITAPGGGPVAVVATLSALQGS